MSDPRQRAYELNEMAVRLYQQGQYQQALAAATEALHLAQEHLGEDHPDTAQSLNNLGFLLQATGDYAGARSCYEQALAINRRALGPDHPHTALRSRFTTVKSRRSARSRWGKTGPLAGCETTSKPEQPGPLT
jgi:tetratricopeptide (TPR) repeat protein